MSARNPEFQRQIWLNWKPSLLAWSLGLTLLVLALPLALSSPNDLWSIATTGLLLASFVYGSVLTGRSLAEEANQNTWDWQRLSALSPWQMAWGKLLGAALPAWLYVLWFALAIAVFSTTGVFEEPSAVHIVGFAVLGGLALQTLAMNAVLMGWGQQDRPFNRKRAALLPLILLFFMPGSFWSKLSENIFDNITGHVLWWGVEVGGLTMAYLTAGLVLALGLLGLWRMLCTRLDVRTLPWAWPLGITVCGFFAGGTSQAGLHASFANTAWIAMLATAYVALQHMDQHLRAWRQVQWSASQGHWRQALEALPLWPVSLLLNLIASISILFMQEVDDISLPRALGVFSIFISLQLLRDCLLLTGFALLAGKLKSPVLSFVIAWLILNIVAPMLAYGVADTTGAMLIQPVMALWIMSIDTPEQVGQWVGFIPWASLGLQILLVLGWVTHVFRTRVLGFARDNATSRI